MRGERNGEKEKGTRGGGGLGGRDGQAETDEPLLSEFDGESSCDALEFAHRVSLRVHPEAPLGATKRDVHHGALVCHERCQGLHLVPGHVAAISNAYKSHIARSTSNIRT